MFDSNNLINLRKQLERLDDDVKQLAESVDGQSKSTVHISNGSIPDELYRLYVENGLSLDGSNFWDSNCHLLASNSLMVKVLCAFFRYLEIIDPEIDISNGGHSNKVEEARNFANQLPHRLKDGWLYALDRHIGSGQEIISDSDGDSVDSYSGSDCRIGPPDVLTSKLCFHDELIEHVEKEYANGSALNCILMFKSLMTISWFAVHVLEWDEGWYCVHVVQGCSPQGNHSDVPESHSNAQIPLNRTICQINDLAVKFMQHFNVMVAECQQTCQNMNAFHCHKQKLQEHHFLQEIYPVINHIIPVCKAFNLIPISYDPPEPMDVRILIHGWLVLKCLFSGCQVLLDQIDKFDDISIRCRSVVSNSAPQACKYYNSPQGSDVEEVPESDSSSCCGSISEFAGGGMDESEIYGILEQKKTANVSVVYFDYIRSTDSSGEELLIEGAYKHNADFLYNEFIEIGIHPEEHDNLDNKALLEQIPQPCYTPEQLLEQIPQPCYTPKQVSSELQCDNQKSYYILVAVFVLLVLLLSSLFCFFYIHKKRPSLLRAWVLR